MKMSETEVHHCEVCGKQNLETALNLGTHPMCDDLVVVGDTRTCKEYPIEILFCGVCRTAHQRLQIPKRELFPSNYHYRSRLTADVLAGMREFVAACENFCESLAGKTVLDIGCNDGSLLTLFRKKGANTFGIEPTDAALDARASGHIVKTEFLDESSAARFVGEFGKPDIITLSNVFAHIEDLPAVLRSFKTLSHDTTVIVIENHYLGAILEKRQFDTFYHEHPRTYSYRSFSFIAETLGMRIGKVEFPSRYGGNIRVILAPSDNTSQHAFWKEVDEKERNFGHDLTMLAQDIDRWRGKKAQQLQEAVQSHGPLRAKAFPGRSAIPVKMLNLDHTMIAAVYEKPGSGKIGHYVPGTRIPIKSDDEFAVSDARPIVNMAWHITEEIGSYMHSRGYAGPIIDIIAITDFER